MSYARTLRRSMFPQLQPDGFKIIEGKALSRTKKGIHFGDRYIHPRKGWRYPSIRAAHATLITAEIKRGQRPWSSLALRDMLASEGLV